MLISVNGDEVKVVKEMHQEVHPACEALNRVKDELAGVMEYKNLNKHSAQKRYALAAEQEFQHMLLALDDFFSALAPELTHEEHLELVKFFKAVTPTA